MNFWLFTDLDLNEQFVIECGDPIEQYCRSNDIEPSTLDVEHIIEDGQIKLVIEGFVKIESLNLR